jgi:hypothetical protein
MPIILLFLILKKKNKIATVRISLYGSYYNASYCTVLTPCVEIYKVVYIWPGQTVTCLHTISPGHIWTTLYISNVLNFKNTNVNAE